MSACPDTTNVKLADVLDGMELLARNTYEPTPSRGFGTDWQKREAASVGGLVSFLGHHFQNALILFEHVSEFL